MSKELGTLAVVVLKAKNLHDRHSFYKQDPYAKISLNGKTFKTEVDPKGGQHPEWDAEFRFPVYSAKKGSSRQLEVACWRAESREDEEIGKGKVDISETLKTGEFDGEFESYFVLRALRVVDLKADGMYFRLFTILTLDRADWVTINDVSGTYRGEIYLEMTFFASGPQPLERRPSKLPPQERLHHLKQGAVPAAGANLTVPGGPTVSGPASPKKEKPFPTVHESQSPPPFPPTLRPGSELGVNGQGRRPSEYTSPIPINSPPPSSLTAGRPPAHRNDTNPFRPPGQHSQTTPGSGYNLSYSPPRQGHSPPRLSYSPPRQPQLEYNPYVSGPAPPSGPGSAFFPSPQIVVDHTPPESAPFNIYTSGSSYSPPQPSPPQHSPPRHSPPQPSSPAVPIYANPPSFPSLSPRPPSPKYHPPQPTSSPYPLPQSTYPPSQPGYPHQQASYPPPSQPPHSVSAPPQFPSHQPTFPLQPQGGYHAYDHTSPPPGPVYRPFFGREDSMEELPDPALTQRYSSPLPLPNDTRPYRTSSPFPVPKVPPVVPPPHPVPTVFSPSADYERELQRRREQEVRDEELAKQLDMELNLSVARPNFG